ncbi:uncharacterized protein ACLA_048120 [Aspergillus clavatus NRRL 1]|uniref:Uncharacterized protein n=1 Tax=Aspergillus clavatus (strain ATCC 1007 / CBS 513.65 / DSM 816 / NCTC 3887 / NRRL 1 / QM 1276 / 107) TaxID=344612 RepID=A1CHI8_ASPCL|nr:uncharacterized protein ACLA_048120 [Aspergillus clavatus NRRL 1]EAW10343.1 conserved hypothetical protein [Aspergillus clavatus NRRL 1]
MYIPAPTHGLVARQNGTSTETKDAKPDPGPNGSDKNITYVIVVLAAVCFLSLIAIVWFVLRYLRKKGCSPKYIPSKFLKEKWTRWNVGKSYDPVANGSAVNRNASAPGTDGTEMAARTTNTVRRDASIRSIATLPAYSANPNTGEQVIAREGERDGMDTVVEYPETAEEEEARREGLMASLYQARVRRREELAAREARRQARREARVRGDHAQLELLRDEDRRLRDRQRNRSHSSTNESGSTSNLSSALEQSRGRDRRISSVSYADVGYVRHDGSRVRAPSLDSDRRPLLFSTPSAGFDTSNRSSLVEATSIHSRGESYSSASTGPVDPGNLTRVQSQAHSMQSTMPSTPGGDEGDVGDLTIPPPDYDNLDWGEAPPYQSPDSPRGEQVARSRDLTAVPTIHVDVASPVSESPRGSPGPAPRSVDSSLENSPQAH